MRPRRKCLISIRFVASPFYRLIWAATFHEVIRAGGFIAATGLTLRLVRHGLRHRFHASRRLTRRLIKSLRYLIGQGIIAVRVDGVQV